MTCAHRTPPTISVIIPVYNMAPWIQATLNSVLEQSFSDLECIVVDDGSTDDTAPIIQHINDPRLHYIHQARCGVSTARNTGISHATGDYITFLDGDDLWHQDFLTRMLEAIQRSPELCLVWCDTSMFIDKTYIHKPHPWGNIHATGNIWWDMLQHMYFSVGAFITKKTIVNAVGMFDPSLTVGEDRDYILRILSYIATTTPIHDSIIHIPQGLKFYRLRDNSAVTQATLALQDEWRYMEKHLEHPALPKTIKKNGYSNLAFKLAVIAAFGTKDIPTALHWYRKAIMSNPWNLNLYLLPLKKLIVSLLPKKTLSALINR